MKKNILITLCACLMGVSTYAADQKVLISQVVEHPALDRTTEGIIDGLSRAGYERGQDFEIRIESAQASPALASQIAIKFVNQNPGVVIGVGTLSAQSFAKYASDERVRLIFSSVTDPEGADLVESLENPGRYTSGVSNFVSLEPQLQLFLKLQPNLKRLGVLYNPGEINSVSIVKKLEKLCPELGLKLIKQTVIKTADVAQNAVKLSRTVDAIFTSNDNTVLSALPIVVRAVNDAKIPLYVSDTDAVEVGAVAALGPNQYEVGLLTGKMAARVLEGEDPGEIPVEFPDKMDLYINLEAAEIAGITIPQQVRENATCLIEASRS